LDVVKLIRKARLDDTAKAAETGELRENLDFISLNMITESKHQSNASEDASDIALKGSTGQGIVYSADPSRKRTRRGAIKRHVRKTGKPTSKYNCDGSVIKEWRSPSQETGTPWFDSTPSSLHIEYQLDREILSFYDWAKPQEFENVVRRDLVERLNIAFQSRYAGTEIHAFGSFASGIYLPTADIDLVLLSDNFRRTGVSSFGERKGKIYAISGFRESTNVAVPGSIECVTHARVPILKFVDRLTGLSVDMSFDNNSGLMANETFQTWKEQFPIMPVILLVVKQFLLIRGLNEVRTGGLGGFSVTCLVTSLLQHLPKGHMQLNPGSVLLEFFNFYGNKFQYNQAAICLDPPGYFSKKSFGTPDRLTIEDPNNTDNDISGGTRAIDLILRTFASAHTTLKNRMEHLALVRGPNKSILGPIIAANFEKYTEQHNQLRRKADSLGTECHHRRRQNFIMIAECIPLPCRCPPGRRLEALPLPPVQQAINNARPRSKGTRAEPEDVSDEYSSETKLVKPGKGQIGRQARRWRAARMKYLRPDLKNLPSSITVKQALWHGGYATNGEMKRDLSSRERSQAAV
ncbi:PAP/25A-associated, partial [Penicillium chrysogenum]